MNIEHYNIKELKEIKNSEKYNKLSKNEKLEIDIKLFEDKLFDNPHRNLKKVSRHNDKKKIEKEYWKKHKEYKKQITRLFRKAYHFLTYPELFVEVYENILARAEFEEVFSSEFVHKQKIRLYENMEKPEQFKKWIEKSKKRLKKKGIKISNNAKENAKKFAREKLKILKNK